MGMYTELQFSAKINYDKHEEIIDVLRYMVDNDSVDLNTLTLPEHGLFKTNRWEYMLRDSSYYFPGKAHCLLNEEHDFRLVSLTVLRSLKNYDQEIEKFLDWIRPYVIHDPFYPLPEKAKEEPRLFVGYKRYEEDIDPSFIYFTKNDVKFIKPAIEG